MVDHLCERDGEGRRDHFFHDVWYDKNEKKAKIISFVWYRDTREKKE